MLRTEEQPFFNIPKIYDVAGKVFILGEYAVLHGRTAVVASVGPRFKLHLCESTNQNSAQNSIHEFSKGSPAERLLDFARKQDLEIPSLRFEAPAGGFSGFGSSTAEFALTYAAIGEEIWERRWPKVLKLYRELMADTVRGITPSGADLVSQWQGSVNLYEPEKGLSFDLWPAFDWSSFIVLSAADQHGRKVATHEHLGAQNNQITSPLISDLELPLQAGIDAIKNGSREKLGHALDAYGDVLARAGLEIAATSEDRKALRGLDGVAGVKGCGALQADAVLVLMKSNSDRSMRDNVIRIARERGLKLVADGLSCETGISCQRV